MDDADVLSALSEIDGVLSGATHVASPMDSRSCFAQFSPSGPEIVQPASSQTV